MPTAATTVSRMLGDLFTSELDAKPRDKGPRLQKVRSAEGGEKVVERHPVRQIRDLQ